MKTIAIDGNEANVVSRVGVNVYALEILKGLFALQDTWKGRLKFTVYLKEKPLKDLPPEVKNHWEYKVIPGKGLWVLTKLMPHLWFSKNRPDLLFSPSHYTVPFLPIPRVCSIMDLGYLKFSGQFKKIVFWQLKYWSAISMKVSKHIIAISTGTKEDIVRHYPFASKKITVTQLGFDSTRFNTNISLNDVRRISAKYHIVDDYIIFLSTLKPSKNVEGLLDAFSKLREEKRLSKNIKLVIVGKKGWMYEQIFEKVRKLNLEGEVIFTDFLPEEDKPALLKGAKLLVAPSFWEGFGLIALEAMAVGTPVVVSNIPSFSEVVDGAGILVNPESTSSIAEGIGRVLNMPEKQYNELVGRGLAQSRKFSWGKTAKKTLDVLEESLK